MSSASIMKTPIKTSIKTSTTESPLKLTSIMKTPIKTPIKTSSTSKSPLKSPKFMKPSEVFRMRKKKRLLQTTTTSTTKPSPIKMIYSPLKCLENSPSKDFVCSQKSFSPFKMRKTPIKARKMIRNSYPVVKKSPSGKRQLNFHNIFANNNNNINVAANDEDANMDTEKFTDNYINGRNEESFDKIDWSLKTKIRFLSCKSFPFRGNFRATEEATGITTFVRCNHNRTPFKSTSSSSSSQSFTSSQDSLETSFAALLHKQCLVWCHPNLPWLQLFPRSSGSSAPGAPIPHKPPTFNIMPNTPLADALHNDWCASIKSLYQLLKVRQCPYFYVCANSFTVLFRAAGIAGYDEIQILISPTSQGLRKLFTQEGINFCMPFVDANDNNLFTDETLSCSEAHSMPVFASCDDEPNGAGGDEEPTEWLESLGLSQQDFPSLQPKRKSRSINSVSRKKSLVMVKGMSEAQLFLNFLMNTRVCIANSGPLSGVPPTLLAPVAFHGATLNPLKLKHSKVDQNSPDCFHCLDITGPILPNTVNGLISLFKETQGSFRASLTSYEQTTPFTACKTTSNDMTLSPSAFATASLNDCGLENCFLNLLCSSHQQMNQPFSDIVFNHRL